jgi:hypothetical protein
MLLNRGVYYDDWVWYVMDKNSLMSAFAQLGNVLMGYYFGLASAQALLGWGISAIRVLTFLYYLVSALIFNSLLKTVREIDDASRLALVLLFALFPFDGTRPMVSDSFYAMGYMLFFVGLWLTTRYLSRKVRIMRIAALCVFFLSFMTGSLLVFYAVAFLYVLYREGALKSIPRSFTEAVSIARIGFKYLDFVLLPFAFWILRYLFWLPNGMYKGYNEIHFTDLGPQTLARNFGASIYYSIIGSIEMLGDASASRIARPIIPVSIAVFVLVFSAVFLILRKRFVPGRTMLGAGKMFLVGCILFGIGIFPYLALGKVPVAFSLTSRWMLLLPAGFSFITFSLIEAVTGASAYFHKGRFGRQPLLKAILVSLVIALFVSSNIMVHLSYQVDYYKQRSLIENLSSSEAVRDHTTFLFADHAVYMNVFSRTYRVYEYTSMMKYVFGDEKRFGCNAGEWERCVQEYYPDLKIWNFRQYNLTEPQYVISVYEEPRVEDNVITLMFYEIFDPARFNDAVARIVTIRCDPLPAQSNSSAPLLASCTSSTSSENLKALTAPTPLTDICIYNPTHIGHACGTNDFLPRLGNDTQTVNNGADIPGSDG